MAKSIDLALGGTFGLLTDCEEGTWTPELYEKTSSTTEDQLASSEYTLNFPNAARYSKMGKRVSVTLGVSAIIPGTRTGNLLIRGLPYAIDSSGAGDGFGAVSLLRTTFPTSAEAPVARANANQGYIEIYFNVPDGSNTRLSFDDFNAVDNNSGFQLTVEYYTT
jgi:hypothetical protein